MFKIRMGVPEMETYWNDLVKRKRGDKLDVNEEELLKKLIKVFKHLSLNPRHPSLQTHDIDVLSKRYDIKIWQSYLDQGRRARRIYWAYGPNRREITVLGIEPHPEDTKRGAYHRIKLSNLPEV